MGRKILEYLYQLGHKDFEKLIRLLLVFSFLVVFIICLPLAFYLGQVPQMMCGMIIAISIVFIAVSVVSWGLKRLGLRR